MCSHQQLALQQHALHTMVYREFHQQSGGQQHQQQQDHQHQLATLMRQHFPPVNHGFAYGSGVFVQPDLYQANTPKHSGPMLDFMFAVDDPQRWHAEVQRTLGLKLCCRPG
jgi:hypothetical protein